MTEEEKKEILIIINLLTEGVMTDDKVKEAYERLSFFYFERKRSRIIIHQEVH